MEAEQKSGDPVGLSGCLFWLCIWGSHSAYGTAWPGAAFSMGIHRLVNLGCVQGTMSCSVWEEKRHLEQMLGLLGSRFLHL